MLKVDNMNLKRLARGKKNYICAHTLYIPYIKLLLLITIIITYFIIIIIYNYF